MVSKMDKRRNRVVLSLGGNIGDVKKVFINALQLLENKIGQLILLSSLYHTKAWGVENQPDFLNQVVIFETILAPAQVLKICLKIEKELGRIRKEKWHERVIDIDVLFYESKIVDAVDLKLPHPYIQDRNFILDPLSEIMPEFVHPILGKTLLELKKNCNDKLQVIRLID